MKNVDIYNGKLKVGDFVRFAVAGSKTIRNVWMVTDIAIDKKAGKTNSRGYSISLILITGEWTDRSGYPDVKYGPGNTRVINTARSLKKLRMVTPEYAFMDDENWNMIVDYCRNDVIATEELFGSLQKEEEK